MCLSIFAMRARRYERRRNFQRSTSVWIMIRPKLVLGSKSPVISSTVEIWALMRFVTRSMRPSWGQLGGLIDGEDSKGWGGYDRSSGVPRSLIHDLVRACRSTWPGCMPPLPTDVYSSSYSAKGS